MSKQSRKQKRERQVQRDATVAADREAQEQARRDLDAGCREVLEQGVRDLAAKRDEFWQKASEGEFGPPAECSDVNCRGFSCSHPKP